MKIIGLLKITNLILKLEIGKIIMKINLLVLYCDFLQRKLYFLLE